jgi:hypothetical protein
MPGIRCSVSRILRQGWQEASGQVRIAKRRSPADRSAIANSWFTRGAKKRSSRALPRARSAKHTHARHTGLYAPAGFPDRPFVEQKLCRLTGRRICRSARKRHGHWFIEPAVTMTRCANASRSATSSSGCQVPSGHGQGDRVRAVRTPRCVQMDGDGVGEAAHSVLLYLGRKRDVRLQPTAFAVDGRVIHPRPDLSLSFDLWDRADCGFRCE